MLVMQMHIQSEKPVCSGVHIVQDLQFTVGQEQTAAVAAVPEGQPVATISKVSRGHYAPQQFTSVREWFYYAFSSIESKGEILLYIKYLNVINKVRAKFIENKITSYPSVEMDSKVIHFILYKYRNNQ